MNNLTITSARQAMKESKALKTIWSKETLLTQRILIYIAELLEAKQRRPKRKPSAWQKHVAKALRAGKTIKQAAAEWRDVS